MDFIWKALTENTDIQFAPLLVLDYATDLLKSARSSLGQFQEKICCEEEPFK
jgi:hypothetical protein